MLHLLTEECVMFTSHILHRRFLPRGCFILLYLQINKDLHSHFNIQQNWCNLIGNNGFGGYAGFLFINF